MESITQIFRIGVGPSSSHTMGPRKAAEQFNAEEPKAVSFRVNLYGSLSLTGKGHLTDQAIVDALKPKPTEILWNSEALPEHPNGMKFESLDGQGEVINSTIFYSPGGGAIHKAGEAHAAKSIYKLTTMDDIMAHCIAEHKPFWTYVLEVEGESIMPYLEEVRSTMKLAIRMGLKGTGFLPGGLNLDRKARPYNLKSRRSAEAFKRTGLLASFALAVSEENAGGGTIVTAPTCGACGVVPAVLRYLKGLFKLPNEEIVRALMTAGLVGNLTKFNASISGAEVGCQGEVGTACAMAAAAAAQLMGGSLQQIEYAAEMGLEHHLGLTCDPIAGLVQIPCIERNAIAATRAMDCADLALLSDGTHRISFDEVVETMFQTGKDLCSSYRETSLAGLAKVACMNP